MTKKIRLNLEKICEDFKVQLEESLRLTDHLKGDNLNLRKSQQESERQLEELKTRNDELLKKERSMKEELAKTRAQLVSLERIFNDLKTQFVRVDHPPPKHK